ncbi:hypothetical protein IE81DRAFT_364852 [Ceraceosorus guamensis]|uniref:Uncharacterized protein n=1 Tax=Ceraceosorus guamensis TaxID=1522189 RepID=A0A316W3W0_9BASI|nr:hypothetical protein IE81DRAFT_364852 [Ceraceosorus guamensis]PWN44586.1 hypothetical protein IE81DRAFT_364852 [Ceraceosorus guamensis]
MIPTLARLAGSTRRAKRGPVAASELFKLYNNLSPHYNVPSLVSISVEVPGKGAVNHQGVQDFVKKRLPGIVFANPNAKFEVIRRAKEELTQSNEESAANESEQLEMRPYLLRIQLLNKDTREVQLLSHMRGQEVWHSVCSILGVPERPPRAVDSASLFGSSSRPSSEYEKMRAREEEERQERENKERVRIARDAVEEEGRRLGQLQGELSRGQGADR